jgi:hypothetical protein
MDNGPTNGEPANGEPTNGHPLPPASTVYARTVDGRFGKGNRFGRGNPYLVRVHALRAKLAECATDDDLTRIVRKLSDLAAEGDVSAARLWLEYAVGRPVQALELSGPDGEPLGGDLATLRSVILTALDRHPAAKVEVAMALMRLRCTDGPDTGSSE